MPHNLTLLTLHGPTLSSNVVLNLVSAACGHQDEKGNEDGGRGSFSRATRATSSASTDFSPYFWLASAHDRSLTCALPLQFG